MVSAHQKAKITWHCRRGMLELDLLLNRFLSTHIEFLALEEVEVLEKLLTVQDPQLYAWLMGFEQPMQKEFIPLVNLIRACNTN